jgi:hypothetical protein
MEVLQPRIRAKLFCCALFVNGATDFTSVVGTHKPLRETTDAKSVATFTGCLVNVLGANRAKKPTDVKSVATFTGWGEMGDGGKPTDVKSVATFTGCLVKMPLRILTQGR